MQPVEGQEVGMDVISSVNSAIKLVLRLREVAKNVNEAEIRSLIADLANELSDVKLALAKQKEHLASLMEENRALKETRLSGLGSSLVS